MGLGYCAVLERAIDNEPPWTRAREHRIREKWTIGPNQEPGCLGTVQARDVISFGHVSITAAAIGEALGGKAV
jgi:hypothetical protein